MSAMPMTYGYERQDPSRRVKGIAIVLVIHALIGYGLVSGMARQGLNFIKKPLEAVVIQEVIIPPPPPPPPPKEIQKLPEAPKVDAPPPPFVPPPDVAAPMTSNAPVIQSVSTPPPAPAVIAPPPPAVVVAHVTKPNRSDIGVACPTQVPPEMPRKALQDGTEGVVKAQALIRDGVVKEVTILSGPRVFHAAVKAAMLQYKCTQDAVEVIAVQEFNFKVE
jgi:protein TonB